MTQEVFDFFEREHKLTLLDSEYADIQHVVNADLCDEVIYWKNGLSASNAATAQALRERDEFKAKAIEYQELALKYNQQACDLVRERDQALAMVAELKMVGTNLFAALEPLIHDEIELTGLLAMAHEVLKRAQIMVMEG